MNFRSLHLFKQSNIFFISPTRAVVDVAIARYAERLNGSVSTNLSFDSKAVSSPKKLFFFLECRLYSYVFASYDGTPWRECVTSGHKASPLVHMYLGRTYMRRHVANQWSCEINWDRLRHIGEAS